MAPQQRNITHARITFFIPDSSMSCELAVQNRGAAMLRAEPVANLAIIFHIENRQVGVLSRLDTPLSMSHAQRMASIDARRRNRLGGAHAHPGACPRSHQRPRGAGRSSR